MKGAGVLTSAFTENTQKIINTAFAGHLQSLKNASATLGGEIKNHPGYDLSILFHALPRIPIVLHFNDAELGFQLSAPSSVTETPRIFLTWSLSASPSPTLPGTSSDKANDNEACTA